jgi:hypothetical protein
MRTIKKLLKRLLFGKPQYMSVFKDKYGNKYGGTIYDDQNKSVVDFTGHIEEPVYLGKIEIY